jgi:hypothetical protein
MSALKKSGGRPPVYNLKRVKNFEHRLAELLKRYKAGEKDAPKSRRELFSAAFFPALVCPPTQQALADNNDFSKAMRTACTTKGSVSYKLIEDGTKKHHFAI